MVIEYTFWWHGGTGDGEQGGGRWVAPSGYPEQATMSRTSQVSCLAFFSARSEEKCAMAPCKQNIIAHP